MAVLLIFRNRFLEVINGLKHLFYDFKLDEQYNHIDCNNPKHTFGI